MERLFKICVFRAQKIVVVQLFGMCPVVCLLSF
jgi:hypothetical protein